MQAVIEPALETIQPMDRRDNLPELHVDIDPGFERIVEFHAQHGEWRLPAAGVVVRVVIAKHLLVDDLCAARRGGQAAEQGVRGEWVRVGG